MNRAHRRAKEANCRKTAKTHDTLARRIQGGLDTLRGVASLESGIPVEFLGVCVEGEAIRLWDTRIAAVSIAAKRPLPATVDEVDAEGFVPAAEGGAA